MRFAVTLLQMAVLASLAPAAAQEARPPSIWEQPTLLSYPGSPTRFLADHGIALSGSVTQFYQGPLSGHTGKPDGQSGGKSNLTVTIDGGKIGLWQGLSLRMDQEWIYGRSVNSAGYGNLLPVNTALALPKLGRRDQDTAISVTQAFSESFLISAGKFNLLELGKDTPILGGGGLETFMNLGLAAPGVGRVPAYVTGVAAVLKTNVATIAATAFDTRGGQEWRYVRSPFSDGVSYAVSATVPTKLADLDGSYGLRLNYSTQPGQNFAFLSEGRGPIMKRESWFVTGFLQQYLFQDPDVPGRGWGVFADATVSDGNPNPVKWRVLAGVGGTGPIATRPLDRWGVGVFSYRTSRELARFLWQNFIDIQDEKGIEVYYSYAVTPWLRLTGDVQRVRLGQANDPFRLFFQRLPDRKDATIASLRLQLKL